ALRMHWSDWRKLRALWNRLVWLERLHRGADSKPALRRARVNIERRSLKELDPDNLVGSCKVILDALVSNAILEDDSSKHIELHVTQCRGAKQTKITVHAIPTEES